MTHPLIAEANRDSIWVERKSARWYGLALRAEADCAAYRECLKNTYRDKSPKARRKAARHMIENGPAERGREMLKVVKAACIVGHFLNHGSDEDLGKGLKALDIALDSFEMAGATVRKWLDEDARMMSHAK